MQRLAVAAALYAFHKQVFRCEERQEILHRGFDNLFVYMEPGSNVVVKPKHRVYCKERFRQRDAAVCRIIQRALEPLG